VYDEESNLPSSSTLASNLAAISYTDGLSLAGDRTGHRIDIVGCAKGLMGDEHIEPKRWAGICCIKPLPLIKIVRQMTLAYL
jgi:hypothetical protein